MRRAGGRPAALPLSPAHGASLATTAGITSVISGVLVVGLLAQSPAEAPAGISAGCLALAALGLYVARNRVCRALDLAGSEPEAAVVWAQRAQAVYHAAMAAWFAGLGVAALWRLGGVGWGVAAIAGCAVVNALGQALYHRSEARRRPADTPYTLHIAIPDPLGRTSS